MTSRAPERPLRSPLERQHRRHQRSLLWRHAWRAAGLCVAALGVAVLAGVIVAGGPTLAWIRLVLFATVSLLAIGVAVSRFTREGVTLGTYLESVEARFPHLRSWIRNAVDFEGSSFEHVSPTLAVAVQDEAARRLESAPVEQLRPRVQPARPLLLMGGVLLALLVLGFVWPGRTLRSWTTLWHPAAAAPPVRLAVEPGSVTVTPGAAVAVRARVWGTERAPRLERRPGSDLAAVPEGREDGGARVWRFDLAQLTRPQDYWVRVLATKSPRYRIDLAGRLAPVSFDIEYEAPRYARLPAQHGTSARGDLSALRGTRAGLTVTFDRDLESLSAQMGDGRAVAWKPLTPRRWQGTIPIERDGQYDLLATARADAPDESGPRSGRFRYRVTALADAPPVLVVRTPEGDVNLPAGQQIPLDVLAQDDLGLTELQLQVRKGPDDPWSDLPLARFHGEPREARFESRWDASPIGLLPGQVASFRLVLFDDNAVSGRGRTVSSVFELRFPSLADLYENVDQRQQGAQQSLEKVTEQARDLQKTLDKLSRQQPRQESAPSQTFERSEELRSALQRQQEIGRQIDQAAQELQKSIEQSAEREAFNKDLMDKLRQVNELVQQIQSPEFKEALRKMQEALENLDRRALEQQMPQWRAENKQMLENLERTLELLKKLRDEEHLQALAQRAAELKSQQDALNREHEQSQSQTGESKPNDVSARQAEAAKQSEALAKEVREMSPQTGDPQSQQEMEQAAQELSSEAAPSQQDAAQSSRQGKQNQAQHSGQKASSALQQAAQHLDSAAARQQQQQAQLDLAAVRRAGQDLVSLQRASERNLASGQSPSAQADQQTDLSEGTARVADSLYQLSRQTPFISPQLAEAMGKAINGLSESGRELAGGNRARGEEAGRQATESLNRAVLELRSTESAMCNKPGQSQGGSHPNPLRIGNISDQQSQLNQRTQRMAKQLSEQMRLSAGDKDELERMAAEQARIRSQLEQVRTEEESKRELLGHLDQTEREMKEAEEIIRQGAIDDELEQKQQRILSRLLDAQRSVNRRDFDPQRESRPGEDVARESPPELPAELLRQNDRFRQDLLKSELDRYPTQYRAFVEAYLRRLNGSHP
jgi:hypothetical protein